MSIESTGDSASLHSGPASEQDTSPAESSTLFVGLPRTGKTSYLGLLYVSLVHGSSDGFRLSAYDDEKAYLNEVAQRLEEFESSEHTEVDGGQGMALSVRMPDASTRLLAIPDLSGETWETLHVERVWSSTLAAQAATAAGFLVFVHAGELSPGTTVIEAHDAAQLLGDDSDWVAAPDTTHPQGASPTQVAVVDLIQVLQTARPGKFRLSLVLSAFDVPFEASDRAQTPAGWVKENLPLLHQFLAANQHNLDYQVFGVSAQGGPYAVASEVADSGSVVSTSPDAGGTEPEVDAWFEQSLVDRAFVLDAEGKRSAIHLPLLWALGDV